MLNFEDLYKTHAADVYRFAFWLTGDRLEAEDITSEAFARAWTSHKPIRTQTVRAYLFTIARNTYLQSLRKKRNEVALEDAYACPSPGPDTLAAYRLELEQAQQFLQTLPEIDRAAFVLRIEHELPYAEIARVLNLTVSAAKVKVHRIRRRLLALRIGEGG